MVKILLLLVLLNVLVSLILLHQLNFGLFTTPRYESVISCPIPKFYAHESVPDALWPSICSQWLFAEY